MGSEMCIRDRRYTKKEKLEIVSLSYDEDQTMKGLAARFGISENTIYNWRSSYNKHGENAFPGNGNKIMSETERKIAELEKAVKELELEKAILKKAISIFSKSDRKYLNS